MDVDAIRSFLFQTGGLILAPLLFGCPVILFVLLKRDKDRALEKKVITETSQKYVTREFSGFTRFFIFLSMFAWLGLFIPIIIWLILEEAYVDNALYIAAGCEFIAMIFSIIFAVKFMRRKEEYALVDSRGLSIVYKDESAKRYEFERFGQILLYRKRYPSMEYINEKGKKELLDSRFLTYADATSMAAAIREMHARRAMANPTPEQRAASKEAFAESVAQIQKEREELKADPEKFDAHLREVVSNLSGTDKATLVRLIESGEKLEAIKKCQQWTGQGLINAKDIVENYEKYLK